MGFRARSRGRGRDDSITRAARSLGWPRRPGTGAGIRSPGRPEEPPFGHPGRRFDDTSEYFDPTPLLGQGPEPDYTPDEEDSVIHYAGARRPSALRDRESDRGLQRTTPPRWPAASTAWSWLPRTSTRTTSTGRSYAGDSTASRRSPPRAASSGGASSVRPARTAGRRGGKAAVLGWPRRPGRPADTQKRRRRDIGGVALSLAFRFWVQGQLCTWACFPGNARKPGAL